MTSKSYDGLPSTSSTIVNTPHQRNPNAFRIAECSEEQLTYTQNEPWTELTATKTCCDLSSDEHLLGDRYCDNYNKTDNFVDGCNPENNINQHGDDGEEVEILQLDDFWIQRLSQTVKRMKQKNYRKQ